MTDDVYQAAEEAFGGDREMQKRVTISKLNRKQKLVLSVIKNRPEAADSDAVLQAEVWLREGWNHNLSLEDNLRRVTHAETLSRRRRELFNLGLIEYSPIAMKSRETAFRNERDKASPLPPGHIFSPESMKEMTDQLDNLIVRKPEQTRLV